MQYEACHAYIDAHRALGWQLVEQRFDDEGYSGATVERPALQRLLKLIRAGQVDRVVVQRWAANWVSWPGYDRFWTNLLRDLLPRAPETEATVEFDKASNEIVVGYRLQPRAEAPATLPDVYVLGPDHFQKAVPLKRLAASSYQARVPIAGHQGLFRIRPASELAALPELGFYREETELTQYGSNTELLRQIAEATGGRFNPTPRQAFDAGNRSVMTTMDLWPGLLALAVLANLAELAARKGYRLKRLWAR